MQKRGLPQNTKPEFNKLRKGDVLLRLRRYKAINLSGKMTLEKYHPTYVYSQVFITFPKCCYVQVLEWEL